jgi:uncharacterized protein (TIGR02246 family)
MRKLWQFLAILLSAALLPAVARAQDPADAGVRQQLGRYLEAYNRADVDAMAAIYAPDASHTYAFGLTHHGRTEIAQGLREMFAGMMKGTQMEAVPLRIRSISTDVAIEEAAFTTTGVRGPDCAALPPIKGFCLAVYQRQGGTWLVQAIQCMVPPAM